MLKYILRYLIFVGVPYTIARQTEKIYKRYLKGKNNPDNKPDSDTKPIDLRGGENFTTSIKEWIIENLAFRIAISSLIMSSIWYDTADNVINQLFLYSKSIVAAPGYRFIGIITKFRNMDHNHALDIKEILLEKNISNRDKFELIQLKIQYALKHLRGKKRACFITATIALLTFFLGNDSAIFAYFMANLRELLGGENDQESLRSYIIGIYREYNAPLPKELITQI